MKDRQCRFKVVGLVAFTPTILVEGLGDGVGLIGFSCEGLSEAEGEDDLAVSEVRNDVADASFPRSGVIDLRAGERCGEVAQ